MLTLFRWLLRIFTGLAVLGMAALAITYYFLSRSLPDYSEDFAVHGISAPVEIVRNNDDVPHIFGATDDDTYFALGFAHAQDRLWQMTVMRRTVQGRLSEIFGISTLKTDELMRRFDFYTQALQSAEVQDDYTKAALDAYSRGVNAWIEQVNSGARGRGAPEFFLFSNEIAAWQPADSLAILKLMSVSVSHAAEAEVLRAAVSMMLPEARLADILPDDPDAAVAALPDYARLFPEAPLPTRRADAGPAAWLAPFPEGGFGGASNAWAASPARSAAGGSLLANDPHLDFSAPSIWYLARLHLASGDVIGGTVPGIPAVIVGRSDVLGWGLTTTGADVQDIFIEKLNPENPEQYQTPDGWKEFETRRSIITVKDALPVTVTLRWTDNGAVLAGSSLHLAEVTPAGHVAALAWTAFDGADRSLSALLGVMRAGTTSAAIEAAREFVTPVQNLMLADRQGVALQVVGRVPRRDPAAQAKGRLPQPGWISENRWQGLLPYEDNPRFTNPVTGILGNTNNKLVERPFPLHVTFDWIDTQRIKRWLMLMKAREVHTRESFIEAQLDTVSPTARTLLPLVGADLWFAGELAPAGTPERQRQQALQMLAEWNGEMNEHLPEPLIYRGWMRALQDRLIHDELGPLADRFTALQAVFIERVFRDTGGAGVWCDVIQSAPVETCTDIARMALDDALLQLTETYGPAIESWRWGDAHQAAQDHPVLGKVPVLRYFVNIRQSTSGDDDTLQVGRVLGFGPNPWLNVHGPGYRGVYDFSDPESSVFVISTGQSGHPLSRHYDDLGELWRRGEYVPMSLDPGLARAAAVGISRLVPQ